MTARPAPSSREPRIQLIGMLDSPYVRRVAISLQLLRLPFEHRPLSVFRTFAEFRAINPVVKAPTLVCADGTVLADSTLILQYAEALAHPRTLMPAGQAALQRELRLIGLGLVAMEKTVQLVYEDGLRPAEKRHQPWVDRVTGQLDAACDALERAVSQSPLDIGAQTIGQAGVTVAVAAHFTRQMTPQLLPAAKYPALAALSQAAESLPPFARAPHGTGVCRGAEAI